MLAGISVWFLIGCGTARRSQPLVGAARLTSPQQQHGELVFAQNCNKCHPGGEAGLGPAINDKPFPNFLKKFQVRHGLGVMPISAKKNGRIPISTI